MEIAHGVRLCLSLCRLELLKLRLLCCWRLMKHWGRCMIGNRGITLYRRVQAIRDLLLLCSTRSELLQRSLRLTIY